MIFTPMEVSTYYVHTFPDIRWTTAREVRIACPIHHGDGLNFAINTTTGFALCFSQCGRGWDMISFEQELFGVDFVQAKERVYEIVGRPKVIWEERDVQAIYDYTDENGKVLYQVLRKDGKKFVQRRPNANGGWEWGLGNIPRVPFHLSRFKDSEFIAIVEGEKDVNSLEQVGIVGSCNSGGAGNFKPELASYFSGKRVAIFPDNDQPGRDHALKVARILSGVTKSLKIVELPNLPEKGDVTDFLQRGGTVEQLREYYRKSSAWSPEWSFSQEIPAENDQHVRSFTEEVTASGGITAFWDLSRLVGMETPWRKLSRILGGGLRSGEVYVLGGNQGSGKTSLALQFIISAIRKKEGCLLFSMEMGWRAVFQRMASMETEVDLNRLRECQFTVRKADSTPEERQEAQWFLNENLPELAKATSYLMELPFLVSTKPSVTPEYLVLEASRLRKKQSIKLTVVDHMQLMATENGLNGDYEKFTAISRSMKQVAVELDMPVILVSQTSRSQTKEHRGEPEVSDLRGSGALEEDAAAVMLIHEDINDKDQAMKTGDGSRYTKGPVKCFLKVGKNRYGEQGRGFELHHYKTYTRFKSLEET